jgi:hypothetical protein
VREEILDLKRHILITDKLQIRNEILAYWEENRKAKSNLDAIVEWWMLKRKIVIVIEVVEDALNDLVKEGLVCKDKNEMYSIIDRNTENSGISTADRCTK